MEHALRCNDIKCRVELREQALVTTCRYTASFQHNSRVLVAELILTKQSHLLR